MGSRPTDQVMHGLFPKRVEDIVLDVMIDLEKRLLEVLDNVTKSRALARLIYQMLSATAVANGLSVSVGAGSALLV